MVSLFVAAPALASGHAVVGSGRRTPAWPPIDQPILMIQAGETSDAWSNLKSLEDGHQVPIDKEMTVTVNFRTTRVGGAYLKYHMEMLASMLGCMHAAAIGPLDPLSPQQRLLAWIRWRYFDKPGDPNLPAELAYARAFGGYIPVELKKTGEVFTQAPGITRLPGHLLLKHPAGRVWWLTDVNVRQIVFAAVAVGLDPATEMGKGRAPFLGQAEKLLGLARASARTRHDGLVLKKALSDAIAAAHVSGDSPEARHLARLYDGWPR